MTARGGREENAAVDQSLAQDSGLACQGENLISGHVNGRASAEPTHQLRAAPTWASAFLEHGGVATHAEANLSMREKAQPLANCGWYGDLALASDSHRGFASSRLRLP